MPQRTDVIGSFTNDASPIRLAGSVLIEQNDDWLVCRRYSSVESLAAVLKIGGEENEEEVLELHAA